MTENYNAHPAQLKLAKLFTSVKLLGPPMSDKLVELVIHLFTPDEAEVALNLPLYYPKPLAKIVRKAGRSSDEIIPLLDAMSNHRVILNYNNRYSLLPIIPGMFGYLLMNSGDSKWHRKYAKLLIELFSTGYVKRYGSKQISAIRNIPLQQVIENKNRVVTADLMSEMIDRHKELAVLKSCLCRQSLHLIGKDCKRATPEDGCLIFGNISRFIVEDGSGHFVSKEEMHDIVTDRREKGLVFLTGNVSPSSPNAICTCCDCCCHALEAINHFDINVIAPPHFIVEVDESLCNNCGKCAKACNTNAHTYENKKHAYDVKKCLGCGLCINPCKPNAIKMVENPSYKPPSKNFPTLGIKLLPSTVMIGLKAKIRK